MFEGIKKNFGFGCMRLPMQGDQVDYAEFNRMIDAYLDAGFNYFDTAHGYISGLSETALRDCLTARYPRERYILANKLSGSFFDREEDIRPLFQEQLAQTGVDYFDFYLMHSMTAKGYEKYRACNAFEAAKQLKAEGKIRHIAMSFHDKADVLRQILTEQPAVEAVQIQFNYLDYNDPDVQSGAVYRVCREFGKPVIVMEPVKGGRLVNLPSAAAEILESLHGGSSASYAIRYAAGFEGVFMVLSGMSDMAQMEDNLSYMSKFQPLSRREQEALEQVAGILRRERDMISCTGCRYCVDDCPQHIAIPELFACMNQRTQTERHDPAGYAACTQEGGKASDCVRCGRCEAACPQHLKIRDLLRRVAAVYEGV